MGDYDFTKAVFAELGADMHFWKLAIRPGQPVAFGKIQGTLAFGLPGNPVSSMVTFEQLVRLAVMKMGGYRHVARPVVQAAFQETFSKRPDRRHSYEEFWNTTMDGSRFGRPDHKAPES